jgi:type IV pilus assembly PilX-like protein
MAGRQAGAALAVGLVLLTLVTLLGVAAAGSAHVSRLLAQNQSFRENAATAASAGIEMAIRAIVTSSTPASVPARLTGEVSGTRDSFEAQLRFLGEELALPQEPGERLAGAHFEILSTGHGARRAIDNQRAIVMWVVEGTETSGRADCVPLAAGHCHRRGDLERLSWQRVPLE